MGGSCWKCGKTWGGSRTEHCTVCHESFTGSTSGDMHRTGDHAVNEGPDRRRCLTVDEMTGKGMVRNDRGIWTTGKATTQWWKSSEDMVKDEPSRGYPCNSGEGQNVRAVCP